MTLFKKKYRVESSRLKGWDYSSLGAYFITVCTKNRESYFGEIVEEEMVLNEIGKIVLGCWNNLPNHYSNLILDEFIIMPNHIHGIMIISNNINIEPSNNINFHANAHNIVETGLRPVSTHIKTNIKTNTNVNRKHGLSEFVRAFKSFSSRRINEIRRSNNVSVWQSDFYDRIIRTDEELFRIKEYINKNPSNWLNDENNMESKRNTE